VILTSPTISKTAKKVPFPTVAPVLVFLLGILAPVTSQAQQSGVVGQSERQIRILQERSEWARTQVDKAETAYADNDFESAFALSKSALDALPTGGEAAGRLRSVALQTFSKSSLALANQRISEGRFDDAELVINTATGNPYDSTYGPLLKLQDQLRDPNQFNRTMTPGFIAKVEQVKQLLGEAQGLYASGRYDAAFNDYQKVLSLDPENKSARLGMEQINKQRSDYASTAYSERRSQMLNDVAHAWELPVPKFDTGASTIVEQNPIETRGTGSISRKLKEIRIPQLSLQDETVSEAIVKIQKKVLSLDTTETDPSKKGINVFLKLDPTKNSADAPTKINLSLNDLPLGEALKYVASAANLKVKIEPYAVAIVPITENKEILIKKDYKVPPGFISSSASSASTEGTEAPPAGAPGATATKSTARKFLEEQGVDFSTPGSFATYQPASSKLLVYNTQANLDLVDSLVDVSVATPPSQVEIEARFLEVTQNNLQELGFDWLMGAFQLPGGSGYTGGGTIGNQSQSAQAVANYPMAIGGLPVGAMGTAGTGAQQYVSQGNVTAGNRTGASAISANALDALLFGTPAGPAAGVLALAGVFTNPQFQVVLRAVNQQKGIDVVSAPKVTVTSGRMATISVVRKFPYPSDYSPPQVPQTQGSGAQPATPATPTAFATTNVGVQLQVQPTVGPDGYTIELSLSPQIVEFQGFVNYGTPIFQDAPYRTGAGVLTSRTTPVELTPNTIEQPIFSVRQVDTKVTLYDGQTVVLGGLLREDVQKVQDKTPIVGDLPMVGSLFRSSSNQRIKRNLLIFVTAGLLDPAGQSLIKAVENDREVLVPDAKSVASEAVPGDPSTASKSSR